MKHLLLLTPLLLLACSGPAEPAAEDTTPPPDMADANTDVEILTGKHTVVLKTDKGDITVELDADAAPRTVTNFVTHAKNGYYDGLTFHRVIKDFMVQAGDPNGNGSGGESIWGNEFEDEINAESYDLHITKIKDVEPTAPPELLELTLKEYYEQQGYTYRTDLESLPMKRGAIAMANRGAATNGSQFFIIHGEGTPWLHGKHTVFGVVTDGMDVLDAIAAVEVDGQAKPLNAVTFSAEVQ